MSPGREWLNATLARVHGDVCVIWPYAKNKTGYGVLGRPQRLATHVVLEMTGRPRLAAPFDNALHSCDTPSCVNPNHLRWGSKGENNEDAWDRDRHPRSEARRAKQALLNKEVARHG